MMFDREWEGEMVSPFDGMGLDEAEEWLRGDEKEQRGEKEQRQALLDAHIERLWHALPAQSQRRLGCLAVSAGSAVGTFEHGQLVGALGLIAEAEGTYDVEKEFAETYLGVPWVCEAVAEFERARCQSDARREQTRLAVARYREKQKASESKKERAKREKLLVRLGDMALRSAIAIDGEGISSLEDGSHTYRYLAACLSDGTVLAELQDDAGIQSRAVMEFLAALPKRDSDGEPFLGVFGYGLGYDLTKWLEALKNKSLYDLFHSDDLSNKVKCGPHRLVLLGKCLQVTSRKAPPGMKRTLIWDILKGFQSTFVKALRDWKVGTEAEWQQIEAMKKRRGKFVDELWSDVTAYCKSECRLLARLAETYIRAHGEAGIDLRGKYHGAGSTGDAFLSLMNALGKRCTREVEDPDQEAFQTTRSAFSRAFFGGRAEVSRLGIIKGPVWTADIASAYPHALFELPCVNHGKWRHVSERGIGRALQTARLACVHYRMPLDREHFKRSSWTKDGPEGKKVRRGKDWQELTELEKDPGERATVMGIYGNVSTLPWGPLPYRTNGGSIVFPAAHPGGWAWAPEYRVAKRHFPTVRGVEAWVLRGSCKCERPYRAIGEYYVQRLEWGKQGGNRGKVLKLGMNSCYGKFAQVIGKNPKYSCRVVAGQITATTRSRMVDGILSLDDPWEVIYAATDGLIATSDMAPPNPPENETATRARELGKAPLGQWEVETHAEDLFIVQPGFYFSLKPKGKARTRGTPLEIIDEYRSEIIEQWKKTPTKKPTGLPKQSVFHGVKTSIRPPTLSDACYRRKPSYGTWSEEDRKLNYVVNPKRSALEDLGNQSFRLMTWWLAPDQAESAEYKKDPSFEEKDDLKDDQPDFVEPLVRGVGGDD